MSNRIENELAAMTIRGALDRTAINTVIDQAEEAMRTGRISLSLHNIITAVRHLAREEIAASGGGEWTEPPLTCPHIDRAIASGELPPEVVSELAAVRDINSQLRHGTWALKAQLANASAQIKRDDETIAIWKDKRMREADADLAPLQERVGGARVAAKDGGG